jgi:hypothetical protein
VSQVFWLIFLPGFAVVFFLSPFLFAILGRSAAVVTTVTVIAYTVLFSLFVLVSVCRCAWKTAQLGWGTLASLVVILASGVIVVLSLHALYVYETQDKLRRPLSGISPSNPAFERTAASALRLLAVPSSLRSSAAAQRER